MRREAGGTLRRIAISITDTGIAGSHRCRAACGPASGGATTAATSISIRRSRWTLRAASITFDNAMAAITHLRNQHAALTPMPGDELGDRLATLAADLFSADAAT